MIRYCLTLFPDATKTFTPTILVLSVISVIYGAFLAIGQRDIKRLIAFTSISHFGFITMGIFAMTSQGHSGATLYMFNHASIPTKTFGTAARPQDPSGLPAIPAGGPHVPPFHAAMGVGYGTSRVAQQHRHVPDGWMPAAKYFVEELKVDINQRDADGFTAMHHAAARGDNEMIQYLVRSEEHV